MTADTSLESSQISGVVSEFRTQAETPPGGDPYIKLFDLAAAELLEGTNDYRRIIGKSLALRPMTPPHAANQVLRVHQSFHLDDKQYPQDIGGLQEWSHSIHDTAVNNEGAVQRLMTEVQTNTTVLQRMAAVNACRHMVFPGKSITMADLGCSGAYYPRVFNTDQYPEPFKPMKLDQSPNGVVSNLMNVNPAINLALGIDMLNPDDPDVAKWRRACSSYPRDLRANLPAQVRFEESLPADHNFKFVRADIRGIPYDPRLEAFQHSIDMVTAVTTAYQFGEQRLHELTGPMNYLLKPDGLALIVDFARPSQDRTSLRFDNSWGAGEYGFWVNALHQGKFYNVLKMSDGRCTGVQPGEDWDWFANNKMKIRI